VDADIYYLLARCYHERGSYIETRKYLNKALRTKTNHINSQKMLAQVDQEIIELNKCRKNEGLQEFEVGVRAFYAGNFQKAAEAFTASLAAKLPEATGKKEQFPLIADILMEEYSQLSLYSNLVLSWQKLNRQEEALGYLVAANEVLEPSPWIYFKIGKIYEKKGYWKQAGSRYMAARQLDPKLPGLSSALGFVYKKLGRYDLSVNEFEKEVSENPENPVARYNLAIMYKKVEKTKEARQELEMLRSKLEPGTRFYYTVEEHLENLEARKQ
jgi:tetratricopeptide (TPR) repeat protein